MVPYNRIQGFRSVLSQPVPPVAYDELREYLHRRVSADPQMAWRPTHRRPPSPEEIRFHAWLNERLAALQPSREGVWLRIRRFLFGR
jgi:hypothetical protein